MSSLLIQFMDSPQETATTPITTVQLDELVEEDVEPELDISEEMFQDELASRNVYQNMGRSRIDSCV